jgi:hypothetical protein
MIKNLLNRIFNRSASKKETASPGQVVRVDLDQIGPDAQTEFAELARETSGLTFFTGRSEHGYSLSRVATPHQCPRQAPTQQHYAEWIATRCAAVISPGYFALLSTVIVDE